MADTEHDLSCAHEQSVLDVFLNLDTPEGSRAELIEGEIVVSPAPIGKHEKILSRINWQVARKSAVDMDCSGHKGLRLARGERCVKNYVIPDGVYAPMSLDLFETADSWMPADGVTMVAEVTSGTPERDRVVKRHCYAKAGVPLYLLVDCAEGTVSLLSEPDRKSEDYRETLRVVFGKPLDLPAPFDFALETVDFA
ncbi:Uma2 family endonuclease [Actinomadura adrarensis]|uniref:Uma2 family endonuclease n=1 Tax=Actinomadura adrarensis TaxID=1819600 RepID=A0ABW3CR70_9ACTN